MGQLTRRHFLRQSAAAVGVLATANHPFAAAPKKEKRSATDLVLLGKSGVKMSRLGFGTGSMGGSVQRALGQKEFSRLVHYAYDKGIRYFDTAQNYRDMHGMLAKALEGIDRETYFIQTKMRWNGDPNAQKVIDQFRKELNSEYFDSVLLHCVSTADWPEKLKRQRDDLSTLKERGIVRSHGASVHGLIPLKIFPTCDWLDIALVRINHDGTHMDGPTGEWAEPGNHDEAVAEIEKIHASGTGVIGMKLIGNGDFTDEARRDASIKYVMGLDCIDVAVIGFKSPAEIDEAIERMNRHLNA